jgi:hypothetical protein
VYTNIVSMNDPCSLVLEAAHRIWNEVLAVVQYDEKLEEEGLHWATAEDDDGKDIIILNPHISVMETATALAQAITRLKVGHHIALDDEEFTYMFLQLVDAYTDVTIRKSYLH